MKHGFKLAAVGLLPLGMGFVIDHMILSVPVPRFLFSLLLLLLWGALSFFAASPDRRPVTQAALLCLFGLLMLALVLYQEWMLGAYWMNWIGFGSQMYFLPILPVMSILVPPFLSEIRLWTLCMAGWFCLFLMSWLSCFLKNRRNCGDVNE